MKCTVSAVTVTLVTLGLAAVCGGTWWPFSAGEEEETVAADKADPEPPGEVVPFEMKTAEQKFLAEAQQFLDLPALDRCQHQYCWLIIPHTSSQARAQLPITCSKVKQERGSCTASNRKLVDEDLGSRVIVKLRQSCGEVTEEGLGKLSVELLNCQSQTERRQTFPCTQDMSLAECTSSMDPHMWNAYHIVSNRARSVCYATRQQQFRRQTEVAVNRLSQSTLEQLTAMQELASSHSEIKKTTQESLHMLHDHQAQLVERQREVIGAHESVRDHLANNLLQLEEEKMIIHRGQEQLTNMTRNIHTQLEFASELLGRQEKSRQNSHQEILKDITSVRENIREVWERVDGSTGELLRVMGEISAQYQATLDNLRLINSTVSHLLSLVAGMDSAVTSQLQWLARQLGGAQDGLRVLISCASHACFLLIATLCVLFIRAPAPTRVALLVLVVGNLVAEVKFQVALNFYALCALETIILIGNWLYLCLPSTSQAQRCHTVSTAPCAPALENKSFSSDESDDELSKDLSTTTLCDKWSSSVLTETVSSSPAKYPPTPANLSSTPLRSSLSRVSHTSTPRSGRQCVAHTRTGMQCRLAAAPGQLVCHRHCKGN